MGWRCAMLMLFATACGPGAAEASPWAPLELAYIAAPADGQDRRVRVSDAAGIEAVDLAPAALMSDNVAWSTDGTRLAYVAANDVGEHGTAETYAVRMADADDDDERGRISTGWFGPPPAESALVLSWAAGDRYIAVTVPGRSWAPQCYMPGLTSWLVDLEGVDGPAARPLGSDVDAVPATWSEDGRALAYAEQYLICGDDGVLTDFGWIVLGWDMAEDLGGLGSLVDGVGPDVWGPAWSPRDRTLAANAGERDAVPRISRVVAMEPPAAKARVVFEVAGCSAELGAWFPDGERLLVRESCSGSDPRHLVVDVMSGAVLDELADLGASVAIARDGDRVAHLVDQGGQTHVAVHEIGSGESVTIGPGSGPAWRPR